MAKQSAAAADTYHKDLLQLKRKVVSVGELLLDPKNPRFRIPANIPDGRYGEEKVQERALTELKSIGIDDLLASIRSYGFVQSDPIVVRALPDKRYVVLEGNRRVATLKTLMRGQADGTSPLPPHILKSIASPEVLMYEGSDPNIAWILQGLRHMTGIKEWQQLQQAEFLAKIEAELVAEQKKGSSPSLPMIARRAGVPAAKASRLLSSYYALQQAREDEEYGNAPDIDSAFSMLSEGVFKKTSLYRDWLRWDEKNRKFGDVDNFRKLLSWTVKSEASDDVKITRAVDVRDVLSELVLNQHLLNKFENGSIDINEARVELASQTSKAAPKLDSLAEQLSEARTFVDVLPLPAIKRENKIAEFRELLTKLKDSIDAQLSFLSNG